MKTVAVTGLSGVIGQALLPELIAAGYEVVDLYHQHPYLTPGVTKSVQLDLIQSNLDFALAELAVDAVIHLAAITHIDRCEDDRTFGETGVVWQVNVKGTQQLVDYCQAQGIRLIYLSTECVFDGETGMYDEESPRQPKNWYGQTKAAAEMAVEKLDQLGSIIRAVIAYQPDDREKTIFGKIKRALLQQKSFVVVNDQQITPTFTGDIVAAVIKILDFKLSGIYHVSSGEATTPFEFAKLLAKSYDLDSSLIAGVTMEAYFGVEKAQLRLKNATLNGEKTQRILKLKPQTPAEVFQR